MPAPRRDGILAPFAANGLANTAMCGFVAIIGKQGAPTDPDELRTATRMLTHRGPDDEGYFVERHVGLGFRRLSILDLSMQGHQPFEDPDGRYVIVFNGEIYNYIELRDSLEACGHEFRSTGDTEVLLAAYKEWGPECLSRFNGMWAFIIYDRHAGTCFGARDRFGVKPLFASDSGGRLVFASEIKAIAACNDHAGDLNWRLAAEYLLDARLSVPDARGETLYRGIREVPAGYAFEIDAAGAWRQWQFWNLPEQHEQLDGSPVEQFAELFDDAVRLRLRSDVPVGVCLSGGLDSTSIICAMDRAMGRDRAEPLRAFSYIDENFDETREVMATISETNAELHRLTNRGDAFVQRLEEVLWYHDEPLHSLNVLVSYELYRMAHEAGVKVILNGQGADETWAGYPSYFFNYWYELLQSGRFGTFRRQLGDFAAGHDADAAELRNKSFNMVLRNQFRRLRAYRSVAAGRKTERLAADAWFTGDLSAKYEEHVPDFESLSLDPVLRRSVTSDPLPLFLRIEDRNSMAHSIETRLPFMDYRLVQLAFRTPSQWKLDGRWNKHALRETMRGRIPEVVRSRIDKMGFPVSAKDWFAGPLYDVVRETMSSRASRESGVFDVDAILRDLDRHRDGEVDHSAKLLRVVQFQMLQDKPIHTRGPQQQAGDGQRPVAAR